MSATEAMALLREDPRAVLLDVRTDAEWAYVGRPDLSAIGRQPLFVSWQRFPAMDVHPDFVAEVQAAGAEDVGAPMLVLCRSGQRSAAAATALSAAGYSRAFNIADGFEGPKDQDGHRNKVAGWRASGLPWVQG